MILFSVIMPSFNASDTILESIGSVLSQTYRNFELVICDDSSTDSTVQILSAISDHRITIVSNLYEKGAAGARKTAAQFCSGTYICYLDSDDIWGCNYLQRCNEYIEKSNVDFFFSNYSVFESSKGILHSKLHYELPKKVNSRSLFLSNFIPCLTAVHKRELLSFRHYPILYKRNDYAIWVKILANTAYAYNAGFNEAFYRQSNSGLSSSKLSAIKYAYIILSQFLQLSVVKSLLLLPMQVGIAFLKKKTPLIYNAMCRFL